MPLCGCSDQAAHHDPDLDVTQLRGLSEVRRTDQGPYAINDNTLGMQAGAIGLAFGEAARVIKQVGQSRSRPLLPDKPLGEPTQQRVRLCFVSRSASDIETKPRYEVGPMTHAICQGSEDFPPLM